MDSITYVASFEFDELTRRHRQHNLIEKKINNLKSIDKVISEDKRMQNKNKKAEINSRVFQSLESDIKFPEIKLIM